MAGQVQNVSDLVRDEANDRTAEQANAMLEPMQKSLDECKVGYGSMFNSDIGSDRDRNTFGRWLLFATVSRTRVTRTICRVCSDLNY